MVQGIRIGHLCFGGRTVFARVHGDVEVTGRCAGESCVGAVIPLHRRTGTGAVVSALNGFQAFDVAHTDFITVVDERRTWHGKKESESNFQLIPLQTACQTVHIMVSGRDADQAFLCGLIVVGFVGLYKLRDISFSAFGEEWLIAAEQIVVMGRSKVKQEVHVEAAL